MLDVTDVHEGDRQRHKSGRQRGAGMGVGKEKKRDEESHLQIVSVSRINIFWGFWSSCHDPILDGF